MNEAYWSIHGIAFFLEFLVAIWVIVSWGWIALIPLLLIDFIVTYETKATEAIRTETEITSYWQDLQKAKR